MADGAKRKEGFHLHKRVQKESSRDESDLMQFDESTAVTLEISAEYFPWFITEAKGNRKGEILPGRFIRVRNRKNRNATKVT